MNPTPKSICVFCGSKPGLDPSYSKITKDFAKRLVQEKAELVYGGGSIGLMGVLADQVKASGGRVVGVIPEFLHDYEVGHDGLDELILTKNMHTRKEAMFERADGFVVLPGGLGTLDEFFEILTWKQLQLHQKPIVIFNQGGFWAPIVMMIDQIIETGFAHEKVKDLISVTTTLDQTFEALKKTQHASKEVLTSHF